MTTTKQYIESLFKQKNIDINSKNQQFFEEYINDEKYIAAVKNIQENQTLLIMDFVIKNNILDIKNLDFRIPNGTVGLAYSAIIDYSEMHKLNLTSAKFIGLDELGLVYNDDSKTISGIPTQSGDLKIQLLFNVKGEVENAEPNIKLINLVINADPKSLWKDIPSDIDKDDEWRKNNFWKPDIVKDFQPLGNKHIVVASTRGRSHANVGSFRDDDYAYKYFDNTGWSVVVVSDGAGSAKVSRKGSELACKNIVEYFEQNFTPEVVAEFDEYTKQLNFENSNPKVEVENTIEPVLANEIINVEVEEENSNTESQIENKESLEETKPIKTVDVIENNITETTLETEPKIEITVKQKIGKFIYNHLGNAAQSTHKLLDDFAKENGLVIKDLHSTLIFALYKKYEFGYVVLTFGVGDCPIGIINKDETDFKLMNWLDVGEFGGGTRFITMPEIFSSDKFSTRFGFKLIEDFSYLMLMTDGIYDPKFVVEANLEKLEQWQNFIADLKGNNPDNCKVDFDKNNVEIANQLSAWMNFWSAGNHDDRTLAIVF